MLETRSLALPDDIEHVIVVSDLHALTAPLDVIDSIVGGLSETVQIIAAGDYFVNGLHPRGTLDWVRRRAGEFAIMGNHDEGALNAPQGDFPIYTEAGSFNRLDNELKAYLAGMPHIIELTWRGKHIRVTHDRPPAGKRVSYKAMVPAVVEMFVDPTVDLTVCAHTHYPFIEKTQDTIVANTGSTSCLLLGHKRDDGGINPKGRAGEIFEPPPEIYSTYLSVVIKDDCIQAAVEHFTYDCEPEIRALQDMAHPTLERLTTIYRTGLDID